MTPPDAAPPDAATPAPVAPPPLEPWPGSRFLRAISIALLVALVAFVAAVFLPGGRVKDPPATSTPPK